MSEAGIEIEKEPEGELQNENRPRSGIRTNNQKRPSHFMNQIKDPWGMINHAVSNNAPNSAINDEAIKATENLLIKAQIKDDAKNLELEKIEAAINHTILTDKSPEAKLGRRKMAIRAAYGEFMCTLLFYTPIFGAAASCAVNGFDPTSTTLAVAFVGGFQAIGVSFAFSSVSGAHFNSSISFALWLTGKLSNRKLLMYVTVQLLASIIGMAIVASMFHGDPSVIYNACAVYPTDVTELGKAFATEFWLTFILTYTAFTVAFEDAERQKKESMSFKTISDSKGLTLYASTPQSKTGFAPFSIGFAIFSLSLIGGSSGGAFNPGRMFGPALYSGKTDLIWLYWLGEVLGASCAGIVVSNMHRFGLEMHKKDELSAKEVISKSKPRSESFDTRSADMPSQLFNPMGHNSEV